MSATSALQPGDETAAAVARSNRRRTPLLDPLLLLATVGLVTSSALPTASFSTRRSGSC